MSEPQGAKMLIVDQLLVCDATGRGVCISPRGIKMQGQSATTFVDINTDGEIPKVGLYVLRADGGKYYVGIQASADAVGLTLVSPEDSTTIVPQGIEMVREQVQALTIAPSGVYLKDATGSQLWSIPFKAPVKVVAGCMARIKHALGM